MLRASQKRRVLKGVNKEVHTVVAGSCAQEAAKEKGQSCVREQVTSGCLKERSKGHRQEHNKICKVRIQEGQGHGSV